MESKMSYFYEGAEFFTQRPENFEKSWQYWSYIRDTFQYLWYLDRTWIGVLKVFIIYRDFHDMSCFDRNQDDIEIR
jgi:hypothetical protein